MNSLSFSRQEREAAEEWIEDETWVSRGEYKNDKEYLTCVQDILNHPVFKQMDEYYQHGDTTCKEHCIRVSYMSYKICRKYGWNYFETARAALLHDMFLYDWHTHAKETGEHFHGFTHPRVAMNNAARYFDLTERQKDMILHHMWPLTPIPPRYKEGYSVIYADKYCGLSEVVMRMRDRLVYILCPVWARR